MFVDYKDSKRSFEVNSSLSSLSFSIFLSNSDSVNFFSKAVILSPSTDEVTGAATTVGVGVASGLASSALILSILSNIILLFASFFSSSY